MSARPDRRPTRRRAVPATPTRRRAVPATPTRRRTPLPVTIEALWGEIIDWHPAPARKVEP